MTTPAISLTSIDKRFGAVPANRGADLTVAVGEIHALVGENGAGKSTLMRILAGVTTPDAGTVAVDGRDVTGWSAADAITAGVGMVHQHFMLVPPLSVAENVVLGLEPRRGFLFARDVASREVAALCERTGLRVPVDAPVASLSVGEAQRVEILKVLYRGARILVLDEPTAVLSPPEVDELWAVLRSLRDEGGTVVLITHKLDEVMAISDRITVMRAGRTVERLDTARTTPAAIARAMVGRDVALAGDVAQALGASGADGGWDAGMAAQADAVAGEGEARTGSAEPAGGAGVPGTLVGQETLSGEERPVARGEGDGVGAREVGLGGSRAGGSAPGRRAAEAGGGAALPGDPASVRGGPPTGNLPHHPQSPSTTPPPPRAIPRDGAPGAPGSLARTTSAALHLREVTVATPRNPRALDRFSLDLRAGEIVGIAGVEGNGQTELVEAIAGLAPLAGGSIHLGELDISAAAVRVRSEAGLSHIPEDRQHRGLILDYSIADNLILGEHRRFAGRGGALDRARILAHARERIAEFDIRPADPLAAARTLSGGNQQKIVIAREMGRDFSVLLASQPTRGVDVGAIEFIHGQLRAARAAGKAVLLVSADLTEVLALSDRVGVLYGGRLACLLDRADASAEVLGPYMMGVDAQREDAA